MDAIMLLSFLSLVLGVFGLVAFGKVNKLSKQVYLLRSDIKMATSIIEGGAASGGGGGSCGCGGSCGS